jgi:hypothetical protein
MIPTLEQWIRLGLDRREHVRWALLPNETQRRVRAECSVVRSDGWTITYPDPGDWGVTILIGRRLPPQRTRDIAAHLRGELDLSVLLPNKEGVV